MNNLFLPSKSALAAFALCTPVILLSARFCAAHQPQAREIMRNVYEQTASRSMEMNAAFEVFDRQGREKKKEFQYRRLNDGEKSRMLAVFTAPEEVRGVALLSIQQPGLAAEQYIYTPASGRVRSVAAQERSSRFLGTDFSYEEIDERALDDFSYRLIGDQESIDGRKTYKIEARPVSAGRSQYGYIYYWIAQDAPVIVYAQMFDSSGALVRTLHATGLRRANGVWGARQTEMSTPAEGTRTVLSIEKVEFNLPLDASAFTPQALAAPAARPRR